MSLTPGTMLSPYRLVEQIGEGGMGVVWRATDTSLGRDVAIKVLPEAFARDPERMARFEREARVLASLNHPGIAAIYGVGSAEGTRFLAMELVTGDDLAVRLAQGPVPVVETIEMARQIAEALEAAHEKGIIHRDLKPANVKLTPEGRIKILDFGLAKAVAGESSGASGPLPAVETPTVTTGGTQLGAVLGTLTYMSPEQARGKPVDRRTDIWSFGCLVYECLTASRAFAGEVASETIGAILHLEPDWSKLPPAVPPRVRELLRRCMEKDARKRLRDIGDARIELEQVDSGASSPGIVAAASSYDVQAQIAAPRQSRRTVTAVVIAGVAIAGAVLGSALTRTMVPAANPGRVARVSIEIPASIEMIGRAFEMSPDGRSLVILGRPKSAAGAPQEPVRLYLRRLGEFDFTAIKGTEDVSNTAFSPDGEAIAFTAPTARRSSERRLLQIALDGSAPPVAVGPWDDAWQGLVWLEGGDYLTSTEGGKAMVRLSGTDGRPNAPVAIRGIGPEVQLVPFRMLPGGRRVLAQATSYDNRGYKIGIVSVDPVTGDATTVVADGGIAFLAPDGQLVFSRRDAILTAPFDLAKSTLRSAPVAIVDGLRTPNSWTQGHFVLATDGSLAYTPGGQVGSKRRLVLALPGGAVEPWSDEEREFDTAPSVTSDGERAAVVVTSAEGTYEMWIAERGRAGLRRFMAAPGTDIAGPVWSPDGATIAYYRIDRTEADGIYVARAGGGGTPRRVLRMVDSSRRFLLPETFTPDGTALVVSDVVDGKSELVLVPVAPETGDAVEKTRPLVTGPGNEGAARFSPDGNWLAWNSNESGKLEVYLAAVGRDGTVGSPVPVSRGGGSRPVWSADGRTLYFTSPDEKVMASSFDPRTGAAMLPKSHLDLAAVRSYEGQILPDGRVFVIQKGLDEAEVRRIDLVLNWTQELKGK